MATRRGAYPGTFNPPTVAHLAIATAARSQCRLDRVELVLSTTPLGKAEDPHVAPLDQRLADLERVAAAHPWLAIVTTEEQLLADIAEDYDVLILGGDKWAQVLDPAWYSGTDERDAAIARLPQIALAPRPPHPLPQPSDDLIILDIDPAHHEVSATAVRNGRVQWRAPGAGTNKA
jgi:hypothetical protein